MDYYLNTENTYNRLLKEYHRNGGLVVAFDFDNTVYDFHEEGWEFPDMVNLLRELKAMGCYLIVFTANEDEGLVARYCEDNDIPFNAINENPPFWKSESRKIFYNILLDDRAGLRETYDLLTTLVKQIKYRELLDEISPKIDKDVRIPFKCNLKTNN